MKLFLNQTSKLMLFIEEMLFKLKLSDCVLLQPQKIIKMFNLRLAGCVALTNKHMADSLGNI